MRKFLTAMVTVLLASCATVPDYVVCDTPNCGETTVEVE